MDASRAPKAIRAFWAFAPEYARDAVVRLSAAVALTDALASWLLEGPGFPKAEVSEIIEALHACGFVVERNSEWQFTQEVRTWLGDRLYEQPEVARQMHEALSTVAEEANPSEAGDTVPAYLIWPTGRAYHTAALRPAEGLAQYAQAYRPRLIGEQWLLGLLAEEQQRRGILPATAIEPAFLRGMTLYREGRWQDAERLLRRVADSDERRRAEVAVAKHVVGVVLGNRRHQPDQARKYLEESLAMLKELGDRHGQAQVLNTWGDVEREAGEWETARGCYQQVLELSDHPVSVVVAHLGLSAIAETHDLDLAAACEHMRQAVASQKQTKRQADVRRHERRLEELARRLAERQAKDGE